MENYVGKRIDGRYEIQDIIGVGGMAVVYKAYDNIDDRIVAVKILKEEFLANEEFRRRFKNESKAIAILSHPNIVKVYDVSFGDRLQYIVMEYIEGITLKEYIEQQGCIDWNEALYFIIQILKALQHAHDKGIVHRDIKPQNIMLLENGTIKVADFGIARFSRGETRTMSEKAIGSVHYISPEQAKGELTDEKADIYSVGVMLYEMLTGKLPFDADSAVTVALMQIQSEAKPPRSINSSIPLGFEQITLKAMQKQPRDRYQTAAEMLLDIEELKENPSVKFDYEAYFVDKQPTQSVGVIQEKGDITLSHNREGGNPPSQKTKTITPAPQTAQKVQELNEASIKDAVSDTNVKKSNTKLIAILAGIVAAIIIFAAVVVGMLVSSGTLSFGKIGTKKIDVDNFIGKNYELEIKDNEQYKDLYNFQLTYISFSDGEEGCVYDQDPKAGSPVTKGATVKLTIIKSGEGQIIPDFTGYGYKEVRDKLESMGFTAVLSGVVDSQTPVGNVIRTEPGANTSVLAGSTITVYYSIDASSAPIFKMPDLEGKSLTEATAIISEKGLVLSKTETADSTIEKDYVISQSPSNGIPVKKGDSVILTISTGLVSAEKTINLPDAGGTVSMKVELDGTIVETKNVNAAEEGRAVVKVSGKNSNSKLKVYLDDMLYFEATVNFSKTPARFSSEKYYKVNFYVDVLGMQENSAISALHGAGYKNVTVTYAESDEENGIVINQTPSYVVSPHAEQDINIELVVSKTPETTTELQPVSETETQPEISTEPESETLEFEDGQDF